jgi:hypothetical protein
MQKNPDYRGCADLWSDGSLQDIKIHESEFLYDFALKRNKLLGESKPRERRYFSRLYPRSLEKRLNLHEVPYTKVSWLAETAVFPAIRLSVNLPGS